MDNSKIITVEPIGFTWKTLDPFLFCAYHRDEYPEGNEKMGVDLPNLQGRVLGQDFQLKDGWRMYHGSTIPGFPYHPHRGFETITINEEGVVDHSDSMGAAGRFMTGDTQWMTAGKGIQHSEMFPLLHANQNNPLEIFQIWLNLPKKSKMVVPHFKMLWKEDIPVINLQDNNQKTTTIKLIAGKYKDRVAPSPPPDSWANDEENAVRVLTVQMDANAMWELPRTSALVNRSLFFYKGNDLQIDKTTIKSNHLVELKSNEDICILNGGQTAHLLILEGKPINEPVVQHGPYVMNTQEEIRQTMKDYGKTQFGGWPSPETELVHPKDVGRFAKHADGTEEVRGV